MKPKKMQELFYLFQKGKTGKRGACGIPMTAKTKNHHGQSVGQNGGKVCASMPFVIRKSGNSRKKPIWLPFTATVFPCIYPKNPSLGMQNRNITAYSACAVYPRRRSSRLTAYFPSPSSGCPACANCARIWCVRPVIKRTNTRERPSFCASV